MPASEDNLTAEEKAEFAALKSELASAQAAAVPLPPALEAAKVPSPAPHPTPTPTGEDRIDQLAIALQNLTTIVGALVQGQQVKPPEPPPVEVGEPDPKAPPMPPMDFHAGDKTPEVVAWYKQWWPREYERRYKGRRTIFSASKKRDYKVDSPEVFATDVQKSHDPRIAELPAMVIQGGLIDPDNLQPL